MGALALSFAVMSLTYRPLVLGMLVSGVGAGLLNGETTKVGMSAIPAARSGMASGITGTVRFAGLVLGIAALGAVFFFRTSQAVDAAYPRLGIRDRAALVHRIVSGSVADPLEPHGSSAQGAARAAFADGYQALLATASGVALIAALLSWGLVRTDETAPIRRS